MHPYLGVGLCMWVEVPMETIRSLELESQATVSHPVWALGAELVLPETLSHVSRPWQWSNLGCQDKSVYDVKQCIIVCLSLLRHWRKSLPGNFRNRKCSLKWPGSPNASTPQRRAGSPNSTLFPPYIPLGHSGSSVLIWICLLSASLCSLPRVWLQRQSPASSWFLEFLSWILLLNKDEGQTN